MNKLITYTGRRIDPFEIEAEDICIRDIAHHLSNICRFNGATQRFYSVAQHCVHVSTECPDGLALWGLLHDAAEAYIGDIIRPVKSEAFVLAESETHILMEVSVWFGLIWPMPDVVKEADDNVLSWEMERVRQGKSILGGMQPKTAEKLFLNRFRSLSYPIKCPYRCRCGRRETADMRRITNND